MALALTELEKAYIAGFVDGEGHISIRRMKCPASPRGYRFTTVLSISNTNRGVLDWIHEKVGDRGSICASRKVQPHHKQAYHLAILSRQAADVVAAIEPYLIVKKEQAVIVAAFAAETAKRHAKWRRGLTAEEFDLQQSHYDAMRSLNRKGVPECALLAS